jgi:hypothetical protein
VVKTTARKPQTGTNILRFKVRKSLDHLFGRKTVRPQVKDIDHADAHAAYAWAPTALLWVDGDSLRKLLHCKYLLQAS